MITLKNGLAVLILGLAVTTSASCGFAQERWTSYERRARGGHSGVQYSGKQISGTCLGHRGNSGVSDLHGRASPDGIERNVSRQHRCL